MTFRDREKERYKEISAFTSGVAHEIKNPLNSLALLFELLGKKIPDEFEQDISLGSREIQKISRVIDHFSAWLKPLDLKKEKLTLKELMADLQDSITREDINIRYAEEGEVVVHADKGLLSQAISNLLQNSLEATDKGEKRGPKGHVGPDGLDDRADADPQEVGVPLLGRMAAEIVTQPMTHHWQLDFFLPQNSK